MFTKKDNRKKFLDSEEKRLKWVIKRVPETYPYQVEVRVEALNHIREGIRQDYDRMKEELAASIESIANENKLSQDKRNKKALQIWANLKESRSKDLPQMEEQMKELDKEIVEIGPEFVRNQMNKKIESARALLDLVMDLKRKSE